MALVYLVPRPSTLALVYLVPRPSTLTLVYLVPRPSTLALVYLVPRPSTLALVYLVPRPSVYPLPYFLALRAVAHVALEDWAHTSTMVAADNISQKTSNTSCQQNTHSTCNYQERLLP